MNQNQYEPVIIKDMEVSQNREGRTWVPLVRQIIVCSCVWSNFFTVGLTLGAPTVIIPQLRREANSTDAVSPEMASWMSSIHGYASIPWFFLPFAAGRFGRKYTFLFVCIISAISYIVLYLSKTPVHILIADILQAASFTSSVSVSVIIIAEYSSPKYRGMFLTIKSASMNWGIWVANALGTFFHWRTIAIMGLICSFYNILAVLFWCESPSWLASRRRYGECAKAQKLMKGENSETVQELEDLIKSCKEYDRKQNEQQKRGFFNEIYRTITDITFYKPTFLCLAVLVLYHTSGKMVCTVYAIDIIKNITADESTAYFGMLFLDGMTVTGMYIGCLLAKYLKRRTLLFTGSIGGVTFLFILSLYLYLVKFGVVTENKYLSLTFLTLFFLFISVGPIILSSSISGELMPLRYRTRGMFVTGICGLVLLTTFLKTGPQIFQTFGLHGSFLFYGSLSLCILILLIKHLPETKDKTLQEIEDIFVGEVKKRMSTEIQPIVKNAINN